MSRQPYEVADVVARFGEAYIKAERPSADKMHVLLNIAQCRTASLGGHLEQCDSCDNEHNSYNSCGNRHCPKCLGTKQLLWIDKLQENTLPTKHYHLVFTLPHQLNALCLFDRRLFYDTLFSAVWRTLHSFGYTHYGCETGAICVLHSWGQNLSLHPHLHCLMPAAGVDLKGQWKPLGKTNNFLYPKSQLSKTFKGKFLDSIKRALKKRHQYDGFKEDIEKCWHKKWVMHCEPSMASSTHVIRYLGQYTHRVAISNHRISNITDKDVFFWAKDYRKDGESKLIKLEGGEFLRRFCQHILPKRFVKIRYYGIYNATTKRHLNLQFVAEKSDVEKILERLDSKETSAIGEVSHHGDKRICPKCRKGRMHVVKELPRIRSPAARYEHLIKAYLN
jgi:hypothetical protein